MREMETEKHCFKCGKTKPLILFTKAKFTKSGVGATCLACDAARQRAYHRRLKTLKKMSISFLID
jgi:hypothetical protein